MLDENNLRAFVPPQQVTVTYQTIPFTNWSTFKLTICEKNGLFSKYNP